MAKNRFRNQTRVHYPEDRNPHDPYAMARRMMVTVACGTARKLGYTWELNRDGTIDVHIDGRINVADDWHTFARWMQEDWASRNNA